jgi:hypothetical protein
MNQTVPRRRFKEEDEDEEERMMDVPTRSRDVV